MLRYGKTKRESSRVRMLGLVNVPLLMLCFACSACSSSSVNTSSAVVQERYVPADPGAVEFVWEAPMVDVVDVPPGLDPEGIYYRPAHQAVVEIRQGRWKYYGKAE